MPIIKKSFRYLRNAFCWFFVGTNRVGKSFTVLFLAMAWIKANPTGIVVGFDPQKRFKDILNYKINVNDKDWAERVLRLSKTTGRKILLILDDYRELLTSDKTPPAVLDLLQERSEQVIEIFYITHNPALLLNRWAYYTTHYSIFATESTENEWDNKIPEYRYCYAAAQWMNNYSAFYWDYIENQAYPDFPYIMIDKRRRQMTAINIPPEHYKNIKRDLM